MRLLVDLSDPPLAQRLLTTFENAHKE